MLQVKNFQIISDIKEGTMKENIIFKFISGIITLLFVEMIKTGKYID